MTEKHPFLKTLFFFIVIPGFVIFLIPYLIANIRCLEVEIGYIKYIGLFLMCVGLIFLWIAFLAFIVTGEGTPMIFFANKLSKFFGNEPDRLVQNSLYKYSRNPMYLAVVLIIFGESLFFQKGLVMIWGIFVFVLFHLTIIRVEEPHLIEKYGEMYKIFLNKTPRWIGFKRK